MYKLLMYEWIIPNDARYFELEKGACYSYTIVSFNKLEKNEGGDGGFWVEIR